MNLFKNYTIYNNFKTDNCLNNLIINYYLLN